MSFNFGSSFAATGAPNAPAPAPQGGGGYGFGAPPPASAAATGPSSFNFSNTSAAPVPGTTAPSNAGVPTTTTPFSFTPASTAGVGSTPGPVAGTPFSFGGGLFPAAASAGTNTTALLMNAPAPPPPIEVPSFETLFPYQKIWETVQTMMESVAVDESEHGPELVRLLQCNKMTSDCFGHQLVAPTVSNHVAEPDMAVRQQLRNYPKVKLRGNDALLTPQLLQEVFLLADDLRVSELEALTLFAQASQDAIRASLADKLDSARLVTVDRAGQLRGNVALAARELYFYERSLALQSLLMLFQHRASATGGPIVQGTDALLQNGLIENLIRFIRELTTRIDEMLLQFSNKAQSSTTDYFTSLATSKKPAIMKYHLKFALSERQAAAECLFFIAYQTQLQDHEVIAMIDLIQDLSNDLRELDPLDDAPSAFVKPASTSAPHWMTVPFHQPSTLVMTEKGPWDWQVDLVKMAWNLGQPQLLRCVSTLVMAVLRAMATHIPFIDRQTHSVNSFGLGNALLPPNSSDSAQASKIHTRLQSAVENQWSRRDILGLHMAGFAILLRSSPDSHHASPRHTMAQPSSQPNVLDVRRAWRECMDASTRLRAFSFARLSLLPALQKPHLASSSTSCDISEFFLSVLAEFGSHFLNVLSSLGERPISRFKWQQGAAENLELRRAHLEERLRFQVWSGTSYTEQDVIPNAVDLLSRPDCMDDVIAFAAAVCFFGPEYALQFWSTETMVEMQGDCPTTLVKLMPSQAVRELAKQQTEDPSLRGSYLSLLAALATARTEENRLNGALTIHEVFGTTTSSSFAKATANADWVLLVTTLRLFLQELDPESRSAKSRSTAGDAAGSTEYYYFDSDASDLQAAAGEVERYKPTELGQENTYLLLSHLALITNAATNSPTARFAIFSVNLPIQGRDEYEVVGQESTLDILFYLAMMPLEPEARGRCFSTVASIFNPEGLTPEQLVDLREAALKFWAMLDACQVVPIDLLNQFPMQPPVDAVGVQGLLFPPSSTSLAGGKPDRSWIPADPRYAIVYELEYVETALGVYFSTEGFMSLLKSLFLVGGTPQFLGRDFRARHGCAPYIEYVVHFVLARATGRFDSQAPLPFRTIEDKCRLIGLAMETVEIVLSQYLMPSSPFNGRVPDTELDVAEAHKVARTMAMRALDQEALVNSIVVTPHIDDAIHFASDFRPNGMGANEWNSSAKESSMPTQALATELSSRSIPAAKSPAFTVLASLMASTNGSLFDIVVAVLADFDYATLTEADRLSLAYALFGRLKPTFDASKSTMTASNKLISRETLLEELRPQPILASYQSAHSWRERNVLAAVRVLCATIAREELLNQSLSAHNGRVIVVPVLRFAKIMPSTSIPKVLTVSTTKVAELLVASDVTTKVLSRVVNLIRYMSPNELVAVNIASAAGAIALYIDRVLQPSSDIVRVLDQRSNDLKMAFRDRLLSWSHGVQSKVETDLISAMLNRILSDLRLKQQPVSNLSSNILGCTDEDIRDVLTGAPAREQDCIDVLSFLLKNIKFVISEETCELASYCFEILYRLVCWDNMDSRNIERALVVAQRLRANNFWAFHVFTIQRAIDNVLSLTGALTAHCFHSVAWILKGSAVEFLMLAGLVNPNEGSSPCKDFTSPCPSKFEALMQVVFDKVFPSIVTSLPLETMSEPLISFFPTEDAIKHGTREMRGATEVFGGFSLVDDREIIDFMKLKGSCDANEVLAWTSYWNKSVSMDCASAHLSDALRICLGAAEVGSRAMSLFIPRNSFQETFLLTIILRRCFSGERATYQSLRSTASRNLALAASFAIPDVLNDEDQSVTGAGGVPIAFSLLCRAVTSSYACIRNNYDVERTSALIRALGLLLLSTQGCNGFQIEIDTWFNALIVIGRACVGGPSLQFVGAAPSEDELSARKCFCLLIDGLDDYQDKDDYVFALLEALVDKTGIPKSILEQLIIRLRQLDENVAHLLQKVAPLKRGVDLLVESGILDALVAAADSYADQEMKFIRAKEQAMLLSYDIATPLFLSDHCRLMSLLLSCTHDSSKWRQIATSVLMTIQKYSATVTRLITNFPKDGSILQDLMNCFALAKMRSRLQLTRYEDLQKPFPNNSSVQPGSTVSHLDVKVVKLLMHIAANPLPQVLLKALPPILDMLKGPDQPTAVRAAYTSTASWWDGLTMPAETRQGSWKQPKVLSAGAVAYAMDGADLLRIGLGAVRESRLLDTITEYELLCGVIRCRDATQTLKGEINISSGITGLITGLITDHHETHQLLQSHLNEAIVEMLALLLAKLRRIRRSSKDIVNDRRTLEAVTVSIVYCNLDSMIDGNENYLDPAVFLAEEILKECRSP